MAKPKAQTPAKPDDSSAKALKSALGTLNSGTKRAMVDWPAIRRDFRTGKFTDGELSSKHGVSREAIVRRRKREPHNWPQDMTKAVREATNAALVSAMVTEAITAAVTEGHNKVTDTILAAAEINKQVIMGHRQDLARTREVASTLLAELANAKLLAEEQEMLVAILAGSGAEPKDEAQARALVRKALDLGNRVSSIKSLAETFTKIQAAERVAFRLDDAPAEDPRDDSAEKDIASRFDAFAERLAKLAGGGNAPA